MEAVLRFVYDASTLSRDAAVVPELVARLRELVPTAEQVSYCVLDWDRRRIAYDVDADDGVAFDVDNAVYWELRDQEAVCEYFERTGDRRPRKMSDLLRPREWRARELYNVGYAPFQYELAFRLPVVPRYTKTFIFRSSRRDFTERDRLVLELLDPHLEHIDETFERRERIRTDLALTPREREILGWVEAGKTNAQIAQTLWISPLTVRKHLENVYEKLGVRTRTAAVARLRSG
jgi:DNA-binding CsgD family transcriptional regulator